MKYLTSCIGKKNRVKIDEAEQPSPNYESDDSSVFDSDDSSNESTTSSGSDDGGSSSSSETRLDKIQRSLSMFSWSRSLKGLSFKLPTIGKRNPSMKSCASSWENREFWSRDGQSKLKTNVFFASFDQRSKQASGESACTSLSVFIAHRLHSNIQDMPTRAQFDSLIKQGSSEWRKLCHNDTYLKLFPDKHFDLDTVLEANLRPLIVLPQKSFTGFFSPEIFDSLKGAMSFDEIWDEINRNFEIDDKPRIYIVSWKDHFFVLKVEFDACYVIDTFGERLFEGCKKAFILKFDGNSVMHAKVNKTMEDPTNGSDEKESFEIVSKGKECCKEFIKLFLAAIPLRQLKEEEQKKGSIYDPYLHRLLQIDFHYSSLT